jgi:hypothetical protein
MIKSLGDGDILHQCQLSDYDLTLSFVIFYHGGGELGKRYAGFLCINFYSYMWIFIHLKIKIII